MLEIDSAATAELVDTTATELLKEINSKKKAAALLPFALAGEGLMLVGLLALRVPTWAFVLWALVSVAAAVAAGFVDQTRKSVVLLYDLEPEVEDAYGKLRDAIAAIAACAKTWHISASGEVRDRKYHAGASSVVEREAISISFGQPPTIKANLDIPLIPAGMQTLAFTPERLLVFEKEGVGAVSYTDLRIAVGPTKFVENEPVPSDSQVVDRTWKYVNKKGGPDQRFKDNRELPIVMYDEVHFTSQKGLNELIHISRLGVSAALPETIGALASALSQGSSVEVGEAN